MAIKQEEKRRERRTHFNRFTIAFTLSSTLNRFTVLSLWKSTAPVA